MYGYVSFCIVQMYVTVCLYLCMYACMYIATTTLPGRMRDNVGVASAGAGGTCTRVASSRGRCVKAGPPTAAECGRGRGGGRSAAPA